MDRWPLFKRNTSLLMVLLLTAFGLRVYQLDGRVCGATKACRSIAPA